MTVLRTGISAGVLFLCCLSAARAEDNAVPGWEWSDVRPAFDEKILSAKQNMMGAPDRALEAARDAEALLSDMPASPERTEAVVTALWLQAEAANRNARAELALPIVSRALELAVAGEVSDTLRGDLQLIAGRIDHAQGLAQAALDHFLSAHEIFLGSGNRRKQAIALQEVGNVYHTARDFERALSYFDQAIEAFGEDPAFLMVNYNNSANALREMGRPDDAKVSYQRALEFASGLNSPMLNARILSNLAAAEFENNELGAARATADQGLAQFSDGDVTEWHHFLWGVKAQVSLAEGKTSEARQLIEQTFAGQNLEATVLPYLDFHQTAFQIYRQTGETEKALAHLIAVKRLEDEALRTAASANTSLMTARFDSANQKLRIEQLRRGQLERDTEIALARNRQRTLLFSALGVGGVIVLGFLTVGYVSAKRSSTAISRVNEELNKTNEKLAKANKAKSEFLATTSHEIRTPLNGILGMSQILLRQDTLPAEIRERLNIVSSAGNSMKAIVDDLLDVAKIETGNVSVEKRDIDLRPVLEEAILLWRESAEQTGLLLEADLSQCPEKANTDAQRLRQITFNLLSNAIKFTEEGLITLTATSFDKADDIWLRLTVEDTGIGIPDTELETIFEPFHQVDGGKTRRYPGTGLGLSICQTYSKALGGSVSVLSQLGKGSVFTLDIPITPSAPDRITNAATDAGFVRALSACSVLIYEPDDLEGAISEALEAAGIHKMVRVDNDDAFQAALETDSFEIAITQVSASFPLEWIRILCAQQNCDLLVFAPPDAHQRATESAGLAYQAFSPENVLSHLKRLPGYDYREHTNFSVNSTEEKTIS